MQAYTGFDSVDATMKPALQRLFDISLTHIRQQGKPSYSKIAQQASDAAAANDVEYAPGTASGNGCMYRNTDGCQCGAGPFITDYIPEMEGKGFVRLTFQFPEKVDPEACLHSRFVARLQEAHDSAARVERHGVFIRYYEANMERIAKDHGLSYDAPRLTG